MSRKGDIGFKWIESVTIANGQTTSGAADLKGGTIVGIEFPASMTGATVTFTNSSDGGTNYLAVNGVSVTVTSSNMVPINPINTACMQNVKVVSGSAETGAKVIKLIIQNVG